VGGGRGVGGEAVRAVELLSEQHARQRMRERQARERQGEIAPCQHLGRKSVGPADEEREILPLAHASLEPGGELARRELPAALVESGHVISRSDRKSVV